MLEMLKNLQQSEEVLEDYEHEDGRQVMDVSDTIPEDEFYGQVIYAGEEHGLVSPKEYELIQKEQGQKADDME